MCHTSFLFMPEGSSSFLFIPFCRFLLHGHFAPGSGNHFPGCEAESEALLVMCVWRCLHPCLRCVWGCLPSTLPLFWFSLHLCSWSHLPLSPPLYFYSSNKWVSVNTGEVRNIKIRLTGFFLCKSLESIRRGRYIQMTKIQVENGTCHEKRKTVVWGVSWRRSTAWLLAQSLADRQGLNGAT